MYLTVPCLSYTSETSSLFPSQKLLLLRQTTGRRKENDKKNKSETERTQRMLGPFNEDKRSPPHYLFKVMHLLGNVMFFYVYKNKCFTSPILVLFSCQKGFMGSIYQKNAVNLFMEIAMEP